MVGGGGSHHRPAGGSRVGSEHLDRLPAAKGTELERVFGEVLADGKPRTFLAPAGAPEVAGTVLEARVTRGRGIISPWPSGRCKKTSRRSRARRSS